MFNLGGIVPKCKGIDMQLAALKQLYLLTETIIMSNKYCG